MTTFKRLWFFLLLSLAIASTLILLFPYPRVYLFALFVGTIGIGMVYLYIGGATRFLVTQDFGLISAFGVAGMLVVLLYEFFLFLGASSSYEFFYPLHFLATSWMALWLLGGSFFLDRCLKRKWPLVLLWIMGIGGLWFLVSRYATMLLPFWKRFSHESLWWIGGFELVTFVSLGVFVWVRHRVVSTLYTAGVLWLLFRGISGVFWIFLLYNPTQIHWFQYIFTMEWLGLLFGLDGVIYSGMYYPFHKLQRQLQILNEERMLSLRLDRVTRTLNLEAFRDLAHYEVLRQKRQKSDLALLAIDTSIDLRPTASYTCPDSILGLLASSFRANLRAHDVVSHWGGGRFVILLMDTDLVGACAVGKKIRDVVSMSEYLCGQEAAQVKLWMGAAVYLSGMSVDQFFSLALLNLSRAKQRDVVEVVTEVIFEYPQASEG